VVKFHNGDVCCSKYIICVFFLKEYVDLYRCTKVCVFIVVQKFASVICETRRFFLERFTICLVKKIQIRSVAWNYVLPYMFFYIKVSLYCIDACDIQFLIYIILFALVLE